MPSIAKITTALSYIFAVASTRMSAYGSNCQDYYYGECIPCPKEMYYDGMCHETLEYPVPQTPEPYMPYPQYPQQPKPRYPPPYQPNPCKKVMSFLGFVLGTNLGDFLDMDLGLDVGKCNKLLDAKVKAAFMKNHKLKLHFSKDN
ncbi:hypothetical protein DSO57_1033940 [Entomophthora muscae]|uniref:Uncharacterized protein n=2 Tax=Entomophthora muscae TaxID=34485 RepID=A0ACC2SCM8_9FUNG|nr:hypothetical protein DSO57_1034711 [Entomophthora muscae]KAJ9060157.1 hypothetical protein DSO57_1033940 [Entomophthora muscae]